MSTPALNHSIPKNFDTINLFQNYHSLLVIVPKNVTRMMKNNDKLYNSVSKNDKNHDDTSLEDNASWFSLLLLGYLNPVLKRGYDCRKEGTNMEHIDFGSCPYQDRSDDLYKRYSELWTVLKNDTPRDEISLWTPLLQTVGYDKVLLGSFFYICYAASAFGPILIMNKLVMHFMGAEPLTDAVLWTYVSLLLILPILGALCSVVSVRLMTHVGCQIRNILINAIFCKSLYISPSAKAEFSTGKIFNMFSADTKQIQNMLYWITMIIVAPAQIAVALALIYEEVGAATFVGLGLMVGLIPVNGFMMYSMFVCRKELMKIQDMRVKLMNELLMGIRVLKAYAWEIPYKGKVSEIREAELVVLWKLAIILAVGFSLLLLSIPVIQPILIFWTYVSTGNQLDAAKAFTTIALFNLMRFPFAFLPMGLAQFSQAQVSMNRLKDFFYCEEMHDYVKTPLVAIEAANKSNGDNNDANGVESLPSGGVKFQDQADSNVAIFMSNVSMGWNKEKSDEDDDNHENENEHENVDTSKTDKGYTSVEMVKIEGVEKTKTEGEDDDVDRINRGIQTLSDISLKI